MAGEDVAQVQDVAAGNIQGDGTVNRQVGCQVTRSGNGVYDINIDAQNGGPQVNDAEAVNWAQAIGIFASQRRVEIEDVSASQKTVRISDAGGTFTDTDFEFRIGRILG